MKLVLLAVFVFFFVAVPMYLLDTVVMPQLGSLEHSYAQAGATAESVAQAAAR